jgi:ribonuclease HII
MTKVLGIDEAGRGPVIGPLIVAGVMIEEGTEDKIDGVKDSKLLPHKRRVALSRKIKENSEFLVLEVSPKEIDDTLESDSLNLNWLEAQKQADIINELKPDVAIIDCPSPNCPAYEKYLRNLLFNQNVKLIVEHKADANYPTCSAASILAKVRREEAMDEIKAKYGETGPGYCGNEITIKFLKENWNKCPEIFRKSWSTYRNVVSNKDQKSIGDFD